MSNIGVPTKTVLLLIPVISTLVPSVSTNIIIPSNISSSRVNPWVGSDWSLGVHWAATSTPALWHMLLRWSHRGAARALSSISLRSVVLIVLPSISRW